MQFKQNDVKFVRWRTLLNEIESLFEERSTTQQISGTQTPGPHLVIKHSDRSILKDANQLIMYAIKKQGSLNKIDKETAKDFLNKWIPKFYKISDDGSSENSFNLMYTGNAHFLFFRLHGLLCERLTTIRDKSVDILAENQHCDNSELSETPAAQLGMRNLLGVTPDEYYPAFIELVKCYTDGNVEYQVYEDTLREMFTTKAYVAYTMDKVLQSLVKLIFDIIQKDASINIHHSYVHGRAPYRGESVSKMHMISPAELNYRKKIEEKLIEDEFLFRITVVKIRQVSELGIELCNIEDDDEESVKAEVEGHFQQELVQSPSPLFLKRNLLKVKLNTQNREKQFTNAPSTIGMVPLPGSRGKIKYTANKSETYHIPGCLHRAKKSYQDKNGYAVKKHLRFQTIVQNWVNKNAPNSKTAETLFMGPSPEKTQLVKQECYFGTRNVYH